MCYHVKSGRSALRLKGVGMNTEEPQNWSALELRSLGMTGVADPKIHVPHVCYYAKFGNSTSKGVRRNRREPPKLGNAGHNPLAVGAWMTPRNTPIPTCVILRNLVVLGQTLRPLLSRSA